MRTLDEHEQGPTTRSARIRRDLRLAVRLAGMIFAYFTRGWSIRRRYRRAERAGEIYWLD